MYGQSSPTYRFLWLKAHHRRGALHRDHAPARFFGRQHREQSAFPGRVGTACLHVGHRLRRNAESSEADARAYRSPRSVCRDAGCFPSAGAQRQKTVPLLSDQGRLPGEQRSYTGCAARRHGGADHRPYVSPARLCGGRNDKAQFPLPGRVFHPLLVVFAYSPFSCLPASGSREAACR